MNAKFSDFNLEPRLQQAIDKMGYTECTPIQTQIIPHALAGKDVSGLAQTGTGKTAAFLIPLMDKILKGQFPDWKAPNFVLILVPTRELAEQVYEHVQKLSEFSGLRGVSVYGGTSYEKQKEGFKNNVEFVVATPGRLIDLYKENFVDLKQVRAIVFDEADRMFDMGFKDDMKYILQRVPRGRQFLVFSATMNFDVQNTAYEFGADPIEVNISKDHAKADNVKDEIFHVGNEDKPAYLISILKKYNPNQVIIFSNFKFSVEKIARFLTANGIPAMGISSLLSQSQRNRVLELFKAENEKNILVATDVAARGLDIQGVDMVINYELPNDAESYVHRIGRTGRAGAEGLAFSMVGDKDVDSLARVEEYLKHKLPVGWIEDSEIIKDFKPMPRDDGFRRGPSSDARGGGGHGGPRSGHGGGRDGGRDGGRPDHRGGAGRGPRRDGGRDGGRDFSRDGGRDRGPHKERPFGKPAHGQVPVDGAPEMKTGEVRTGGEQRFEGRPDHRNRHRDSRSDNRNDSRNDNRNDNRGPQGKGPHPRTDRPHQGARPGGPNKGSAHPAHRSKPAHAKTAGAKSSSGSSAKTTGGKKTPVQKVTGFFKKLFGK
jgi:ATP-dependent RNA helicase RhlB